MEEMTTDQINQDGLKDIFTEHAALARKGPSVVGILIRAKPGTPLYGTGSDGGPVLGFEDCDVLLVQGCDASRYFTKHNINEEVQVSMFGAGGVLQALGLMES